MTHANDVKTTDNRFAGVIRKFFRQDKQDIQDEKMTHRIARDLLKDAKYAKENINSPLEGWAAKLDGVEVFSRFKQPLKIPLLTSPCEGDNIFSIPVGLRRHPSRGELNLYSSSKYVLLAKTGIHTTPFSSPFSKGESSEDPQYNFDLNNRLIITDKKQSRYVRLGERRIILLQKGMKIKESI